MSSERPSKTVRFKLSEKALCKNRSSCLIRRYIAFPLLVYVVALIIRSKVGWTKRKVSITFRNMDPKAERLERAFMKALDASVNSIADSDLQECFSDLKIVLGASLQKSFMNMVSKVGERIETSFHQINEDFDVSHQIGGGNTNGGARRSSVGTGDLAQEEVSTAAQAEQRMKEVVNTLKRSEIEDLTRSLRSLEQEIKKSKEQSGRLRTQLLNEVDVINLENMKIQHATEQFRGG